MKGTKIILICSILFSCYSGLRKAKCVNFEDYKEEKKKMIDIIDSTMLGVKRCEKYKIIKYECLSDSLLEVQVKTKCYDQYFIFDEKKKLLRVETALKEFH